MSQQAPVGQQRFTMDHEEFHILRAFMMAYVSEMYESDTFNAATCFSLLRASVAIRLAWDDGMRRYTPHRRNQFVASVEVARRAMLDFMRTRGYIRIGNTVLFRMP